LLKKTLTQEMKPLLALTVNMEYFLHNQTALRLKAALFFRPGIVVIDMPLHLQDRPRKQK